MEHDQSPAPPARLHLPTPPQWLVPPEGTRPRPTLAHWAHRLHDARLSAPLTEPQQRVYCEPCRNDGRAGAGDPRRGAEVGWRESHPLRESAGTRACRQAVRQMLEKLGIAALPHGFQSSFRDWVAEETDHPREVVEAALAHVVRNKVEAAFRRTHLFERRRRLDERVGGLLADQRDQKAVRAVQTPPAS